MTLCNSNKQRRTCLQRISFSDLGHFCLAQLGHLVALLESRGWNPWYWEKSLTVHRMITPVPCSLWVPVEHFVELHQEALYWPCDYHSIGRVFLQDLQENLCLVSLSWLLGSGLAPWHSLPRSCLCLCLPSFYVFPLSLGHLSMDSGTFIMTPS